MSDSNEHAAETGALLRRLAEILGLEVCLYYDFGDRRRPVIPRVGLDGELGGSLGSEEFVGSCSAALGDSAAPKVYPFPLEHRGCAEPLDHLGLRSYGVWPVNRSGSLTGMLLAGSRQEGLIDERVSSLLSLTCAVLATENTTPAPGSREARELILQLSEAEERSRKQIAELFHGELQQVLAGVKMHVDMAARRAAEDAYLSARLATAAKLLNQVIERTRTISNELHPSTLQRGGFLRGLGTLVSQMEQIHGLHVQLSVTDAIPRIPDQASLILYRAVQELLFNVVRHGETDTAAVELHRREGRLQVVVEDGGRGFDPQEPTAAGVGIPTVRDRLGALGGLLEIKSRPGEGAQCTITLPIDEENALSRPESGVDPYVDP